MREETTRGKRLPVRPREPAHIAVRDRAGQGLSGGFRKRNSPRELTRVRRVGGGAQGWHAIAAGRAVAGYNRAMFVRHLVGARAIAGLFAAASLVACGAQGGPANGSPGASGPRGAAASLEGARQVAATTPNGTTLVLEVARSTAERARGLMRRAEVPPGTGMIFFFEQPDRHSFWMFQCLVALDLVWLDAQGTVIDVEVAAPPCAAQPCPSYFPDGAASMVIEVAAHEAARLGLVPGARVLLAPAPGPGAP
jgi:hypothetical protein